MLSTVNILLVNDTLISRSRSKVDRMLDNDKWQRHEVDHPDSTVKHLTCCHNTVNVCCIMTPDLVSFQVIVHDIQRIGTTNQITLTFMIYRTSDSRKANVLSKHPWLSHSGSDVHIFGHTVENTERTLNTSRICQMRMRGHCQTSTNIMLLCWKCNKFAIFYISLKEYILLLT